MGEIRFVGTGETSGYPYLVCKKMKFQPESKRKCRKRGLQSFRHFPLTRGLASETDVRLFFLSMTLKFIDYHSFILLFLTSYVA